MTWFKVDDSFYDHPKVFDAPDCAVALWVRAGCWSARNLKDGFVPTNLPARLCDDPETAVRELVQRGLWERASGGFRFHDWEAFQPSASEVAELKAKRAEAGRLGGLAKAAKQSAGNLLASADPLGKQNPAPTRPVPNPKNKPSSAAPPSDDDPDWAAFWAAYPRKVGKGEARKVWPKAIQLADAALIVAAAKRFAGERRGQEQKFTPHPATWLHGERWRDGEGQAEAAEDGGPTPWWLA